MTEVQVMGDAQPTETGISGLLLLPEGRIQLGDRVYLANEEVFGSLPGDWAVHKAAGASQPVKCKRGDSTQQAFRFDGRTWEDANEVVPLTVPIQAPPDPPPSTSGIPDGQYVPLDNFQTTPGVFIYQMGDFRFFRSGEVTVGDTMIDGRSVLENERIGVYRVTKWHEPEIGYFLTIQSQAGEQRFYLNSLGCWFQIFRNGPDRSTDGDSSGGVRGEFINPAVRAVKKEFREAMTLLGTLPLWPVLLPVFFLLSISSTDIRSRLHHAEKYPLTNRIYRRVTAVSYVIGVCLFTAAVVGVLYLFVPLLSVGR